MLYSIIRKHYNKSLKDIQNLIRYTAMIFLPF